jgi:protease I
MDNLLHDKKVAILVADGFEQSEFEKPLMALKAEGAVVDIVSLSKGTVRAWKNKEWGEEFEATVSIDEAHSADYDALVLPGGVINPDTLRTNKNAVEFVKDFIEEEKPVAAICHGPWTLIETGMIRGRKMTSYKSLKTDLVNAGAEWVDQEVVVDEGLVTSRSPEDLPAFCKKMIEEIAEGVHH